MKDWTKRSKRTLGAAVVSAALALGSSVTGEAAANGFLSEVPVNDWSYGAVNDLISAGVVPDYTLAIPEGRIMSRMEMAMIVDAAMQNQAAMTEAQQAELKKLNEAYYYDIKKARMLAKLDALDMSETSGKGEASFTPEEREGLKKAAALADKLSISGYARLEDVTVFIQPWQAKVNLRTGKAKTDIKLDDATIPAGASVTVVGEMKDKYQILYGDAASGWHVTAMAPASQITLTAFSANVRGPAAQGFALLPKNDIDPDNEIDTLVSTVSFPGDTWQEGETYTDRRLAEIIGEVERNGVSYWQLRNQDCGNFYYEKDKCEALLYADMDNARGIVRNVNGTWTATKAEQGLWYYALQAGQEGLLTLKKPDGTVVEYEVYEEMPKETTYAFFLQEGEQVTVQGEGELHPLVKGREPMLLPQYPGDYEENETIFEGSGRFYCDMQIPNVVNFFTLMIRPLPGSANSYAAVSNLFGDADSTELINFFPVPEGGWEHEGTVCENDFAWQEYDCSVFPGMFLEVHNCTVSVFFGNG